MTAGWLVLEHGEECRRIDLSPGEQTLGRDAENDIVVAASFVSRRHARLSWHDGVPVLQDLGSTNGLSVAGAPVASCRLSPGVVVEIRGRGAGDVIRLCFEANGAVAARLAGGDRPLIAPPTSMLQLRSGEQHLSIGRAPGNDLVLDHPQVSRRHATLQISGGRAVVRDYSMNGVFVNGVAVHHSQTLAVGDRIRICCFELTFDGKQLVQSDQTRHARLDALRLTRKVGDGALILRDVTLSALPREMIAIVGASGAGKSTLLDALNGFRPATSGTVLVNGRDYYREFAAMRLMVGYVPQSDVVHRDLPTQRALGYAAALRLPDDTGAAERERRVAAVLAEIGLEDRRATPVGQLSGGQIKRVSMGVELLTRPNLFFLDEPTSGLDPGYEKRMMELLRRLADEGRTIVLITHATQSIELCDHIAVMAPGGWLAYFGPPRQALAFFECSDYPGMYTRLQQGGDGARLAERFREHPAYRDHVQARLPHAPAVAVDRSEHAGRKAAALPSRPPVSHQRQFRVLSWRYAETLTRDRRNLALLLLQAPIIAALATSIAKPHSFTALPDAALSRNLLVILACSMIWLGAMNAAREVVKELPIYRRERMVGLGLLPYLASKYVVLGGLCLLQAAILLVGLGLRAPLPRDGILFSGGPELFVTLLLAAAAGLAMGLAISTLFNNADRAGALVPYLLIPQIIFVVATLDGPSKLLASLTISRWAVQALGATANLNQFGAALGGIDPSEYTHSPAFLLGRWGVLVGITALCALASAVLLKRHDGALL